MKSERFGHLLMVTQQEPEQGSTLALDQGGSAVFSLATFLLGWRSEKKIITVILASWS